MLIRRSEARGQTQIDWLSSRHTFSFGEYFDRAHRGFRSLRVINDDRVAAGRGFGAHPHRDMEILTWVLSGQLAHRDSLGTGSVIHPNDLQRMSAGRGITHSEMNPSQAQPVHFLQIWIVPEKTGLAPEYEQKSFDPADRKNVWQVLATHAATRAAKAPQAVAVHQDVTLYASHVVQGQTQALPVVAAGRGVWLQVVSGLVDVAGHTLHAGDALAFELDAGHPVTAPHELRAETDAELLLFDLA